MQNQFSRTELILGKEAMKKLSEAHIAIFGIGGVGSYAIEAIVRSGVKYVDIFDNDIISITNINRQLFATYDTIGEYKVDAAEKRLSKINPDIKIVKHKFFLTNENIDTLDLSGFDYIIDAIDTVSGKLALAKKASDLNIKIISSMGAGNKLDPTKFEIADVYDTSVCPLAKVMRSELKKLGVKKLKVVYSKEKPLPIIDGAYTVNEEDDSFNIDLEDKYMRKKIVPGSTSFVPPVVGLIIASEVIKDLIK